MAKIKEIDIVQPDFYPAFGCIGPACTDNCCHSWLVTVDKEHYLRYKAVQDPDFQALCARFLARNKKDASTPNNYATMALGPDGRCGFQDEDGGCHIYRVLGPGSLCNTCAIYPRRKNQFLPGVWEYSLNLSCQEAARLACLSGKPVEFQRIRREIDPNDPQDSRQPIMTGSRSGSDPYRQPLRQACLDLMQQRQFPVPERLLNIGLLLRRADRLHREKKQNDITAMAAQLVDQAGQGEFAGLFQRMTYDRAAHLTALELPAIHLMTAVRKPVLRQVWGLLRPLCARDEKGNFELGEEVMDFLHRQGKEKAGPILERQAQAVENYFVCEIFTSTYPFTYFHRGMNFEYHGILLAEQYALLRVLLGLLPFPEGETEEQHLVKAIVALTRITQHSDMGKQVYDIGRAFQMDSLAHAAYLLQ